jgi:hypothetical protein
MREERIKSLEIREEKAERRESKKSIKGETNNKKETGRQILQCLSANEKHIADLN